LRKDIVDWLLEGPAWLKYAVESQLLGFKADIEPVLKDSSIREIIDRLKNNQRGIPAIQTGFMKRIIWEPYWDLFSWQISV
jgi:hypothetical protein